MIYIFSSKAKINSTVMSIINFALSHNLRTEQKITMAIKIEGGFTSFSD